MLSELSCTECGGAGLDLQPDGGVVCRFCGTTNTPGVVCPRCHQVNPRRAEACANCQAGLVIVCPACRTPNWSGLEACTKCGGKLDALTYLADRWIQGTDSARQARLQSIRDVKAEEAAASERRMSQLMEVEAQRQADLNRALARRAARERQLLTMLGIGIGVFILLGAATALFFLFAR